MATDLSVSPDLDSTAPSRWGAFCRAYVLLWSFLGLISVGAGAAVDPVVAVALLPVAILWLLYGVVLFFLCVYRSVVAVGWVERLLFLGTMPLATVGMLFCALILSWPLSHAGIPGNFFHDAAVSVWFRRHQEAFEALASAVDHDWGGRDPSGSGWMRESGDYEAVLSRAGMIEPDVHPVSGGVRVRWVSKGVVSSGFEIGVAYLPGGAGHVVRSLERTTWQSLVHRPIEGSWYAYKLRW